MQIIFVLKLCKSKQIVIFSPPKNSTTIHKVQVHHFSEQKHIFYLILPLLHKKTFSCERTTSADSVPHLTLFILHFFSSFHSPSHSLLRAAFVVVSALWPLSFHHIIIPRKNACTFLSLSLLLLLIFLPTKLILHN